MKHLKNWDNKTWLSSGKYISHINSFLKLQSKINKDTKILDIGCGRGNIISKLQNTYKFNKKPIGIDIVKNNNIKKNIYFKKIDAIKYLKNTKETFDLILIKQTIHFFSKKQVKIVLSLIKKKLNKKGKILIFFLNYDNNEIPCFDLMKLNLETSFKKDRDLVIFIKKYLLKYKIKYLSFKVKISKIDYIKMLKKKYISCLLDISKKELEKGIDQINLKYKRNLNFKDNLICLIYKN